MKIGARAGVQDSDLLVIHAPREFAETPRTIE